jgi:hypothetical protein
MSTRTNQLSYWSNLNGLWESSGLSQQKFCEQEGVRYKLFVYWRGRIRTTQKPKRDESKPQLLKIALPPTAEINPMIIEPPSRLEIVMPTGVKLYVTAESDISKAVALIQLLGGAS